MNTNENPIRLWLDDVRDPAFAFPEWVEDPGPPWMWVKTAEEAIDLLQSGRVTAASLDHDLGTQKTGYDVVLWMEEHGVWPVDGVAVHSANFVAARRMRQAIDHFYNQDKS